MGLNPAGQKKRLMIVDDETVIIHLLKVIATRLSPDIVIDSHHDGLDIPKKAAAFTPDLILLDLKMPGADGFQVLAALRACGETQDIPVVVMTGMDTAATHEKVASMPNTTLLKKPLELPEVRAVLTRLLDLTP